MPLNCLFVFEPLRFLHTCPSVLLSKFASQIKLMQSPVGVSCQSQGPRVAGPKAQGPSSRVPGSQDPGSQNLESQSPRSQGPASQGPGSQVSCLRVPGPGPQVQIQTIPKVSESQVSGSCVSGSRVPNLRSHGPRSRVPGPDFRLSPIKLRIIYMSN